MITTHSINNEPIDAVITWVDGNDPAHREKMKLFLENVDRSKIPGAHPTRFGSVNEIKYCVLSIFKFAPFVRNVYIVTDEQDPMLYDTISEHFPERLDSLKIVDHKEIFRGYEHVLPTFNCRPIESMIWRINGLAEKFIYFNDDIFLVRHTRAEDFFINNRPVIRGNWLLWPWYRLLWKKIQTFIKRRLQSDHNFQPKPSYHLGQWSAATKLGYKFKYLYFNHTPMPINRLTAERFFNNNKPLVEKNLVEKFKSHDQFIFISALFHQEIREGNKNLKNLQAIYVNPRSRPKKYIEKKIRRCETNSRVKFLCLQSLDMRSEHEQHIAFDWLEQNLGINKDAGREGDK